MFNICFSVESTFQMRQGTFKLESVSNRASHLIVKLYEDNDHNYSMAQMYPETNLCGDLGNFHDTCDRGDNITLFYNDCDQIDGVGLQLGDYDPNDPKGMLNEKYDKGDITVHLHKQSDHSIKDGNLFDVPGWYLLFTISVKP